MFLCWAKKINFLKIAFFTCTYTKNLLDSIDKLRSVAQPGSAPDLGSGGRRFESYRSDHFFAGDFYGSSYI